MYTNYWESPRLVEPIRTDHVWEQGRWKISIHKSQVEDARHVNQEGEENEEPSIGHKNPPKVRSGI